MEIAIKKAKGQLSHLIKEANMGEEVIITSHGTPVAEIKPILAKKQPIEKMTALHRIAKRAQEKNVDGPNASHSADFLYDDEGLPS